MAAVADSPQLRAAAVRAATARRWRACCAVVEPHAFAATAAAPVTVATGVGGAVLRRGDAATVSIARAAAAAVSVATAAAMVPVLESWRMASAAWASSPQ